MASQNNYSCFPTAVTHAQRWVLVAIWHILIMHSWYRRIMLTFSFLPVYVCMWRLCKEFKGLLWLAFDSLMKHYKNNHSPQVHCVCASSWWCFPTGSWMLPSHLSSVCSVVVSHRLPTLSSATASETARTRPLLAWEETQAWILARKHPHQREGESSPTMSADAPASLLSVNPETQEVN